ncbi:hypothetical protein BED47_07610 [Gottfriedia luciferensis]|uniref:Uncharacterized protein n=1 Tax=Gottfriedia luciferensis TaxID=178774 RepID=A0ABX2ZQM7_9BACI|nr:DNA modification system-associated small protein [Gottfriedia luciferensis]ODG91511.1 hypothetical protein BED47_07610 [Gottfriedia luciferensis]
MEFTVEEKELLNKIVSKHNIPAKYLESLIKLEKGYSDKNMARRVGIFKEMDEFIKYWAIEMSEKNDI